MPLRRGPAAVARQARLRRKKTPRRVAPKPAPAVVAPAPVAPPPVEVRRDTALAAERAALAEGAVALRKGDAVAALAAVRRHRARFPAGRMIEEREVLRIRALVAADRLGDARAAADVFRARFPRSVFRGAVEAALTERAVRNPE